MGRGLVRRGAGGAACLVAASWMAMFSAVPKLAGDIRLPKIFSDGMVMQRNSMVSVWGWAEPAESLEVVLNDRTVTATATADGLWLVRLSAPPAGGPYELRVSGATSQVVLRDIWVGEVWICSGQSNMEWPLWDVLPGQDDAQRERELNRLIDPAVRLFRIAHTSREKPADDFERVAGWSVNSAESMRGFSAVAIYFAHHLRHRWSEGTATAEGAGSMSDMPLGLIQAAWGGTPAEAWTSREGLDAEPSLKPLLDHWDSLGEKNELAPACLFNGMIAPMRNYSIRGVIWYQGEANVGRGDQYRTLFPRLIRDWRAQFRQGDFSFYFVQLAPFRYGGMDPAQLPEAWDAQRRALELPNTGMAVATDLGDFADIHPRAKDEVGRRLALWALAQDYSDKSIVYSGPMVDSWEVEGSWIRIRFRHVAEGLVDPGEPLREFTICGEDRKFVPAQARVEGTHDVLVWADGVDRPVAARFAWQDTPQPNLFNSAGLPASPFRTDDFVLLSAERSH